MRAACCEATVLRHEVIADDIRLLTVLWPDREHLPHAGGLPVNDLDPLLGHGRVAGQFGQHFGGPHDHGDRGAQFVADIGGEVAFPLQGAVQAMREAIQFAHQAADFVGRVIGFGETGFPLFEMRLRGLA